MQKLLLFTPAVFLLLTMNGCSSATKNTDESVASSTEKIIYVDTKN